MHSKLTNHKTLERKNGSSQPVSGGAYRTFLIEIRWPPRTCQCRPNCMRPFAFSVFSRGLRTYVGVGGCLWATSAALQEYIRWAPRFYLSERNYQIGPDDGKIQCLLDTHGLRWSPIISPCGPIYELAHSRDVTPIKWKTSSPRYGSQNSVVLPRPSTQTHGGMNLTHVAARAAHKGHTPRR